MRFYTAFAFAAILLGFATSSGAQTVSLKFNAGRVSLNAQNASVSQILSEWARIGGTRMVNHQRVGGAPVTLELNDVPERQALDILLRTAAGYVVTARDGSGGGASTMSGVVILPTTSAPRNQPVNFNAGTVVQRPTFEEPREDQQEGSPLNRTVTVTPFPPTPGPGTGAQVVRVGPGNATTFGSTTDTSAQQQRPITSSPQILQGTSRPGEITPAPQPQPQAQPR